MEQLIYEETVKLNFVEGGHRYLVSKLVSKEKDLWTTSTPVTGVTTYLSVISKPALMLWPLREAIKLLEQSMGAKIDKKLLDDAYKAHKTKADSGKKTGKVGHALVEALLLGKRVIMPKDKELLKETESVKSAFEAFASDFKPEVLASEQIFYSKEFNFAGTVDLVANINDKLTVIDFKTTNPSFHNSEGIYGEYFAQLGAYIIGIEEMDGVTVEEAMIVNLPKNGENYKVKSLSDLGLAVEDVKSYFLHALGLYELNKTVGWKVGGN